MRDVGFEGLKKGGIGRWRLESGGKSSRRGMGLGGGTRVVGKKGKRERIVSVGGWGGRDGVEYVVEYICSSGACNACTYAILH